MSRKILVVDDDIVHLHCARDLLEAAGYEVVLQSGAFGATEAVMVHRPDLVLMDVNMPALPGTSLVTLMKAREQTRDVPILLYSSNDEEALREAADRLGLPGYVCKGDPQELTRKVELVLGNGGEALTAPWSGTPPGRAPAR
jgi:CheY-like chemotaxis protein